MIFPEFEKIVFSMTIFDNENVSDFLCGPWHSKTRSDVNKSTLCVYNWQLAKRWKKLQNRYHEYYHKPWLPSNISSHLRRRISCWYSKWINYLLIVLKE